MLMQTQMLTPTTGVPKLRPRSGRTPLQLKNSPADPIQPSAKPKPKPYFEISLIDKENNPIVAVAVPPAVPPETSLAEELSAVKKKLERMRADKERTDKILNEKHALLDAWMKEMEERGEIQKNFEIEVDRLFRLKELKYRCMRVSPMRTLREKEQGKIVNEAPSQSEVKTEETMASESESESESVGGECQVLQSPGSACSQTHTTHTKSDSSHERLEKLNDKGELLEFLSYNGGRRLNYDNLQSAMYRESLLSLPGGETSEDDQH